ncbi:MAG: type II toxin-antitoxin system ParD family antitoxin, partial [Pseudomonadota bacterium]
MANTSITLGKHWEDFIKNEVASGKYGSASEVIRDALRELEEKRLKLQTLQNALIAGEQSGIAENFDMNTLNAE